MLLFESHDATRLVWERLLSDPMEFPKMPKAPPAPESSVRVLDGAELD